MTLAGIALCFWWRHEGDIVHRGETPGRLGRDNDVDDDDDGDDDDGDADDGDDETELVPAGSPDDDRPDDDRPEPDDWSSRGSPPDLR